MNLFFVSLLSWISTSGAARRDKKQEVVHKDRRAAMLQKAGKHRQTASFAKGSVIFLQAKETSYFSLGVICRATDSTKPLLCP